MLCEVSFKDGYTCTMKLIYNWEKCHIYETAQSYLIVPYKDVVFSRVSITEFQQAQREARIASKRDIKWKEIKPTSNSDED
jgi:hypothetical protein